MKKLNLFLVFALVALVTNAQDFPTTSWSDVANTSWYDAEQDEFTLSTAEELAGVAQLVLDGNSMLDKTIIINNDIDLDGNLWVPIGKDNILLFSGTVEGNNHVIRNLWINLPDEDFAGLFGYTANASFSNIHFEDVNIVGFDNVGTLVANLFNSGSVENCSAINISVVGNNSTGGLVGGFLTNSSITKSHAIGNITGAVQVGGLVGTGWDNSEIAECYSEGTVNGSALVGGLVGGYPFGFSGQSVIDNSYSRASVVATDERAGGLIGSADNGLLVKNSYATGTVSAFDLAGGIIGLWGNIVMENIYFDTESSEMTEGVGGFGGAPTTPDITGKTSDEMKTAEIVDLLNASSSDGPWSIDNNMNDGYPILNAILGTNTNTLVEASVKVYPTIFESDFTVSSTFQLKSFEIFSFSGALISSGALEGNSATITATNLSTGVYILTVYSAEGSVSKRIIKK